MTATNQLIYDMLRHIFPGQKSALIWELSLGPVYMSRASPLWWEDFQSDLNENS